MMLNEMKNSRLLPMFYDCLFRTLASVAKSFKVKKGFFDVLFKLHQMFRLLIYVLN